MSTAVEAIEQIRQRNAEYGFFNNPRQELETILKMERGGTFICLFDGDFRTTLQYRDEEFGEISITKQSTEGDPAALIYRDLVNDPKYGLGDFSRFVDSL